ncbi:hypothetical protein CYLTODRAFT_409767 [Cylindrobasidium torrendii FP15055 ss-10]|uniref:Uncharacterized protein n=1 Tax=Cylindrobasidium torrendii FP15055 ss-10 TaxID=1314674 RepID=A0A0D7BI06_9AGAR|nr:hypothetical protein CYLTODRAFT_409767 [Cylindrobasidium torrendii FP15055 ss-10]
MSRPGSADRQALRKQRLVDAEKEQWMEDQEALRMTEDERRTLFNSFATVKTQFFDLDGLIWTRTARKRAHTQLASRKVEPANDIALAPLTNTFSNPQLSTLPSSENWQDTIRAGSDISSMLATYHKGQRPEPPQYISYSKSSRAETPEPLLSEPPTPRPSYLSVEANAATPTPLPSLKRRFTDECNSPYQETKRLHRAPSMPAIAV